MRASPPALFATARVIIDQRDALASQWAEWLLARGAASTISRPELQRELRLLLDLMAEMAGPLRRETRVLWLRACDLFGRKASARGRSAGEVVDELHYMRDLLTRRLAPVIAAMRARQGMAIMLHLNQVMDQGIASAVAGYTDSLVATLFAQNGVPQQETDVTPVDLGRQLDALEDELTALVGESSRSLRI